MKKDLNGSKNPFFGRKHSEESKRKMRESSRKKDCDLQTIELTPQDLEALHGILLADGHLEKSTCGRSARLTYGCKFKETLEDLIKQFPSMTFGPIWQSKKSKNYHIKSSYYKSLGDLRKQWYTTDKIVPENVLLTPLSCLWWFMGDGYKVDYGIDFCTDAFDEYSIYLLRSKLKNMNVMTTVNSKNRIRISSISSRDFMKWFTPRNIASQYQYKWDVNKKERKYV